MISRIDSNEVDKKAELIAEVAEHKLDRDYLQTTIPSKWKVENAKKLAKKTKKPKQKLPDAKKHQIVSFIKSGVRIFGYIFLPFDLATAVIILIVSELVGIFEELV